MSSPKVSIFIPTYRQVTYLPLLLESLARQEYQDYEVIVSDDSPDDAVEQLVSQYPLAGRLHYVRNRPALGTPANWNAAIRRTRGDYIKPMFHDDWFLDESCLGKFVALLDAAPTVDFGFAAQRSWHAPTDQFWINTLSLRQLQKLARAPEWLFFRNRVGVPSVTIFRRRLNQVFDPDLKYAVDWEFYLRAIERQRTFAYHAEPLVCVPLGLDFQVSAACAGNKEVELLEYAHVFNRIYHRRADLRFFYYWIKLFYQFQVDRQDPIYQRICCAYPQIAPYLAVTLRGAALVRRSLRIKQMILPS